MDDNSLRPLIIQHSLPSLINRDLILLLYPQLDLYYIPRKPGYHIQLKGHVLVGEHLGWPESSVQSGSVSPLKKLLLLEREWREELDI